MVKKNKMKGMEEKDWSKIALPMARRVSGKTLLQELLSYSEEEMQLVKNRIFSENRDRKINSILEGKEYVELVLEDDPEYKEIVSRVITPLIGTSGHLYYMDFKYESK
ncbi:hypothetical protein EBU71_03440 [bacterium]|nr:hypothetical protein [Candidatus Elulimicrobium humile]